MHRRRAIRVRFERLHSRVLVVGAVPAVDFQVQNVARDDPEEEAAAIKPDPAEHRARRDVAQLLELIEHERAERRRHLQRATRGTRSFANPVHTRPPNFMLRPTRLALQSPTSHRLATPVRSCTSLWRTEMKHSASLCGVLACVLLFAPVASGQEQGGSIQGVVKDTSGAMLPGVTIEARSPSVVGVNTAVSDSTGSYRFPALPPGRYSVTSTLTGFKKAAFENVDLLLGQALKIDFTLGLASVSEEIRVTAESPIIDVRQNAATAS